MQRSRSWIWLDPGTHSEAETNLETFKYVVEERPFIKSKVNIDALRHIL